MRKALVALVGFLIGLMIVGYPMWSLESPANVKPEMVHGLRKKCMPPPKNFTSDKHMACAWEKHTGIACCHILLYFRVEGVEWQCSYSVCQDSCKLPWTPFNMTCSPEAPNTHEEVL